jgi:hypothetical protein
MAAMAGRGCHGGRLLVKLVGTGSKLRVTHAWPGAATLLRISVLSLRHYKEWCLIRSVCCAPKDLNTVNKITCLVPQFFHGLDFKYAQSQQSNVQQRELARSIDRREGVRATPGPPKGWRSDGNKVPDRPARPSHGPSSAVQVFTFLDAKRSEYTGSPPY